MAKAVKDLVDEKIRNGVCGVTARPDGSAMPKPFKCTIWSPCTMPTARPGMRWACISFSMNSSIAAKSGSADVVGAGVAWIDAALAVAQVRPRTRERITRAIWWLNRETIGLGFM